MDELIGYGAARVVELLQSGEVSVDETLDALEARIAEADGDVNALPVLCFDRARARAREVDRQTSPLAGLPVAIKDLNDVAGVPTSSGCPAYADFVPPESDLTVQRIEASGGLVYAKSNTPEFGSGANTFNDVFGATRNPYDLSRTVGGSSGGAAAALATGCAWLAQGSDLGGSLRTPASFCGVTSLRPSPGLFARGGSQPHEVYAQNGPMARDLTDLALFADAMAGPSALAGLCKSHAGDDFRRAAATPRKPLRVAVSADLGVADTSDEVRALFADALETLAGDGIDLVTAEPELAAAHRAFDVLRGLGYAIDFEAEFEAIRDSIKPENVWNIEFGLGLDAAQIRAGLAAQGEIFTSASRFMQDYDLLVCPAAIVTPFPVEERYVGYGAGLPWSDYYRWLAIVYAITVTTLPVITLPCGKTDAGLPFGIQLIGKPHGERDLFSLAAHLEALFGWDSAPRDPVAS